METIKGDKVIRVLQIYAKLADGHVVNKAEEAQHYGINERSIQRDIDDIRNFLDADSERTGIINSVVYDRVCRGYRLETVYRLMLKNSEVLAICKILLDSRAFTKKKWSTYWISLSSAAFPGKSETYKRTDQKRRIPLCGAAS